MSTVPTEDVWPRPQPGLWRFMPAVRLTPRVGHAMVWGGHAVFVWGGFDVAGLPLNDGALFDPATGTWELLPPLAGVNATASFVAWSGADVFIVSATATRVFDPDRGAWSTLPPPPLPDGHIVTAQVVGTGDGVVVLSRHRRDAEAPPAMFRFEHADRRWRRLPDPPVPMSDDDVVLADSGRVVVHTVPRSDGRLRRPNLTCAAATPVGGRPPSDPAWETGRSHACSARWKATVPGSSVWACPERVATRPPTTAAGGVAPNHHPCRRRRRSTACGSATG
ncbi:MAG TPA: kelch repeat-containing protein [Euzebyales bacterium]|nr:kelch repeat-containing protein [Euzebyales bacterium]